MSGVILPQYADFHVHTTFCDGKNTAEEMVQSAIGKGLRVLGFSGHAPIQRETTWAMTEKGQEEYCAEILRLKEKYKNEISIHLGVEQDYFSHLPTDRYEYVIGSVHMINKNGAWCDIDHNATLLNHAIELSYNGDYYALCEEYFELAADVVRKTNADIIGHFDLVTKFCDCGVPYDKDNPRYVRAWRSAVDALIKTGKPFEINTGAISRGYRTTPYPHVDILHYIAKNGGCAVLSADTHNKDTIAYRYDLSEALVKETGVPLVNRIREIRF